MSASSIAAGFLGCSGAPPVSDTALRTGAPCLSLPTKGERRKELCAVEAAERDDGSLRSRNTRAWRVILPTLRRAVRCAGLVAAAADSKSPYPTVPVQAGGPRTRRNLRSATREKPDSRPPAPPVPNPAAARAMEPVPANCCVTGGSGFVGQRLVEMLIERGVSLFAIWPSIQTRGAKFSYELSRRLSVLHQAKRVVSFDIAAKPKLWGASDDPRIEYMQVLQNIAVAYA